MALDSLMGVGLRPLPGLAPPLVFIERHPDHQADYTNAGSDAKKPKGKYGEYGFDHVFSFMPWAASMVNTLMQYD
jgi:hypothetical protein